jgi:hypothetical protein
MLVGYLVGLIVGFVAFDPNTDIYALLSLVFAVIGAVLGIVPLFRCRVATALGIVVGLYLGMLLSILIWGDPATDDLLEVSKRGSTGLVFAAVIAVLGGGIGSRLESKALSLPALAFLLGGFVGGALFISLGIAPSSSMTGVAPYVFGSGIVLALLVWWLQKGRMGRAMDVQ